MLDVLIFVSAASAALASPMSDAALPVSPPDEIASAVSDCWQAVVPNAVDRSRLAGGGWSLVEATSHSPDNPLQAYTKAGANNLILLTDDPRANDYCTVVARLSSKASEIAALEAMLTALKSQDPKVRPERTEGGIAFVSLPRFAQVDPTDAAGATEDQPAMRIMVGYQTAEQK